YDDRHQNIEKESLSRFVDRSLRGSSSRLFAFQAFLRD
ncbi:unnamed protein product, partial [Brassica rapa subsp. narinosa]